MFKPTLAEIKRALDSSHSYFPVALSICFNHKLWFPLYKKISQHSKYHILLESGRVGRYSMIAYQPSHIIEGKNQQLQIKTLDPSGNVGQVESFEGDILAPIQDWTSRRKAPVISNMPDFTGGIIGFYSYDLVRQFESLPSLSKDDLETPDLLLLCFEQTIIYDHQLDQHWLVMIQKVDQSAQLEDHYLEAQKSLDRWADEIQQLISLVEAEQKASGIEETMDFGVGGSEPVPEMMRDDQIQPSFSEQEFVQAVKRVQEYISAGDVFQVNLSVRQSRTLSSRPLEIYEQLRRINPSPYMGYLHFPEFQLVSASPEQLIKVEGQQVNTRPIAGTRPRGANREEDLQLANELIQNEKERAEHVMLVDLERNDLGKVCQYGSVEVDEFMVIEEYSHVMHIVSNVKGILRPDQDVFDVIRAVFPGGTITGAPKVRTMEIIEELEPVRRGIYTGSIGWIDFNGNMELNIVIRTMFAKDGIGHVQAGAGIVIDSIPQNEYKESLKKAEALWKAYELSKRKNEVRV